jgi:hypothetical protein
VARGHTHAVMKSVVPHCNSHWLTGNGACWTGASSKP